MHIFCCPEIWCYLDSHFCIIDSQLTSHLLPLFVYTKRAALHGEALFVMLYIISATINVIEETTVIYYCLSDIG